MGAIHRNTGDTREHTYRREEPTPGNRPAHEATHAREHTRCTKRSSRADRTQELSKGSRRVQPGLLILFYIYIFFFSYSRLTCPPLLSSVFISSLKFRGLSGPGWLRRPDPCYCSRLNDREFTVFEEARCGTGKRRKF